MPSHARPVLFCFDGSDGSLIALRDAGALLAPRAAVVLTVWEAVATQIAESPGFGLSYVSDEEAVDAHVEAVARQAAERGALTARSDGWDAVARVENTRSTVWQTVVEVADEIDAALVVCGARGRNALKRAVLGSVAEAVLHHSRRVALIAPEPSVT